ncbi:hypothetical protein MRB53_042062 [Persea americana]|nr:hypothetical protein MRB53_042062 [Persea americana]
MSAGGPAGVVEGCENSDLAFGVLGTLNDILPVGRKAMALGMLAVRKLAKHSRRAANFNLSESFALMTNQLHSFDSGASCATELP